MSIHPENYLPIPRIVQAGITLSLIIGLTTPITASAETSLSPNNQDTNSLTLSPQAALDFLAHLAPPRETHPEGVTPLRCDVTLPPWMVDSTLPPWMQEVPPDWLKVNCTLNTETDPKAPIPAISVTFPLDSNHNYLKEPEIVEAFFKQDKTSGVVVIGTLGMNTSADNVCYYQTQQAVLSYEQTVACTRAITAESLVTANINGKVIRFARGGGQLVWRYTIIDDVPYLDFGTEPLIKITDLEAQIREFENSQQIINTRWVLVSPQWPLTEQFPPIPTLPTATVEGEANPDPRDDPKSTPSAEIPSSETAPALENAYGLETIPPAPIGLLSLNLTGKLPRTQIFIENPEDLHPFGDTTIARDPDFALLSQLLADTPFNVQSVNVRIDRLAHDHQTWWEDYWTDHLNERGIFPDRSDTIKYKGTIPPQMSLELIRRVGSHLEITGQINERFVHFSLPIKTLRQAVQNSPDGLAAIQPDGGTNPEIAQMIEALVLSKKPFPAAHTVHPDFVTSIVRSNRPDLAQNTVHTHPFATDGYLLNQDWSRSTYLLHIPSNLPILITGIVHFNDRYYYTATFYEPTGREDILDLSQIAVDQNYIKRLGEELHLLIPIDAVVADNF